MAWVARALGASAGDPRASALARHIAGAVFNRTGIFGDLDQDGLGSKPTSCTFAGSARRRRRSSQPRELRAHTEGDLRRRPRRSSLSGLVEDTWVVVLVRGTPGVSRPLFPILPSGLSPASNTTLADLVDGNLGEGGETVLAFSNPLYVDVDGNGFVAPGVRLTPP